MPVIRGQYDYDSYELHLDFRAFQLSSSLLLPSFFPPLGEERGRKLCGNLHIGMRLEVFFVVTTVANEGENFMGNINYSWHKLFKYFSIALTVANCNQNLWQIQDSSQDSFHCTYVHIFL